MRSQGSLGSPMWENGRLTERCYELPQFGFSSSLIYSIHGDAEGDNLENLNDAKNQKNKRRKEKVIAKALGHYPIAHCKTTGAHFIAAAIAESTPQIPLQNKATITMVPAEGCQRLKIDIAFTQNRKCFSLTPLPFLSLSVSLPHSSVSLESNNGRKIESE